MPSFIDENLIPNVFDAFELFKHGLIGRLAFNFAERIETGLTKFSLKLKIFATVFAKPNLLTQLEPTI